MYGTDHWKGAILWPLNLGGAVLNLSTDIQGSLLTFSEKMAIVQWTSILCRFPAEIVERIAPEVVFLEPLGPSFPYCVFASWYTMFWDLISAMTSSPAFSNSNSMWAWSAVVWDRGWGWPTLLCNWGCTAVTCSTFVMGTYTLLASIKSCTQHFSWWLRTMVKMPISWHGQGWYIVHWFVRTQLCKDIAQNNGWLTESSIDALALWLMWFTTTPFPWSYCCCVHRNFSCQICRVVAIDRQCSPPICCVAILCMYYQSHNHHVSLMDPSTHAGPLNTH